VISMRRLTFRVYFVLQFRNFDGVESGKGQSGCDDSKCDDVKLSFSVSHCGVL